MGHLVHAVPGSDALVEPHYAESQDKGMEVITLDEVGDPVDEDKDSARATRYLAQHHCDWKNFHDTDQKVATALQADGLPLVLVIDANDKIVYFAFGGNEADLRKAIAGLGPQFASAASSGEGKPDTPWNSPNQE